MEDRYQKLVSEAECSWDYIDRLRMVLKQATHELEMACGERNVVTKRMIELETLNAAAVAEQEVLKKALHEAKSELAQIKAELKAAYRKLGGEPPKTCKTCDLWGKDGWSQHEIGYCEGDDHPHGPDDFCSRHCPQKEA